MLQKLRSSLLFSLFFYCSLTIQAQDNLPQDYLTKEFHKGRREAARALLPAHSVMAVFAAPTRTFSNDVEYFYHQNPDLYYFTGYKEPHAVLLLFKDDQTAADGSKYHELFFVQRKDSLMEQWTGRRLGTEGVKEKLGIEQAYTGEEFKTFPIDFSQFNKILFDAFPEDVADNTEESGDLFDLITTFKQRAKLPENNTLKLQGALMLFEKYVTPANLSRVKTFYVQKLKSTAAYRTNPIMNAIVQVQDSAGIMAIKEQIKKAADSSRFNTDWYYDITAALREIKTPEEMGLIRKAVEISCMAHNEVMKAVRPDMSELEIQGLQEFVHKKYGAEGVGYGSIIGAGENGCVLHYMENTKTKIGEDMLLMDVGAEYHGYSADVTRTIPANGKFSPEEKTIYQIVYNAQEAAFKILKDGAKWSDASQAAKDVIANGLLKLGIIKVKNEVSKYYPHGLSHHMGLDVHDKGRTDTLRKGMVITVEPGIYIPANSPCDKKWWSIAVRIEDDALITERDYELLTAASPRSVEGIEKMIAERSALDDFTLPNLPSTQKKKPL